MYEYQTTERYQRLANCVMLRANMNLLWEYFLDKDEENFRKRCLILNSYIQGMLASTSYMIGSSKYSSTQDLSGYAQDVFELTDRLTLIMRCMGYALSTKDHL